MRLFLVICLVVATIAIVDAKKGKKKAKSVNVDKVCKKLKKKYSKCVKNGYAGNKCEGSSDPKQLGKKANKKCKKVENKYSKKCQCGREVNPEPEPETEINPGLGDDGSQDDGSQDGDNQDGDNQDGDNQDEVVNWMKFSKQEPLNIGVKAGDVEHYTVKTPCKGVWFKLFLRGVGDAPQGHIEIFANNKGNLFCKYGGSRNWYDGQRTDFGFGNNPLCEDGSYVYKVERSVSGIKITNSAGDEIFSKNFVQSSDGDCVKQPSQVKTQVWTENTDLYLSLDEPESAPGLGAQGNQERWCDHAHKYLSEYSAGDKVYPTLGQAKEQCLTRSDCGGITEESWTRFTLRKGTQLKQSPSGETSWLVCG